MSPGPLARANLIAFVGTTRPAEAKAFYGALLGLPLLAEDGFALVFDALGTHLRVTTVERVTAPAYTILGWRVDDIDETVRALQQRGVHFERYDGLAQNELAVWRAPGGAQVAWFKDPDGNTLSVTQI